VPLTCHTSLVQDASRTALHRVGLASARLRPGASPERNGCTAGGGAIAELEQHVSEPCSNVGPSSRWAGLVAMGDAVGISAVRWVRGHTSGLFSEADGCPRAHHDAASTTSEPALARGLGPPRQLKPGQAQALGPDSLLSNDAELLLWQCHVVRQTRVLSCRRCLEEGRSALLS